MSTQYKTQCPYCGTQFKLNDAQLHQANGMVRCGGCLKPFQALDHLIGEDLDTSPQSFIDNEPPQPPAAKPVESPVPAAKAQEAAPVDNDTADKQHAFKEAEAGLSQPWEIDNAFNNNTQTDVNLGEATEINSLDEWDDWDYNDTPESTTKTEEHTNHQADEEEDWALALLKEAEGDANAAADKPTRQQQKPVSSAPEKTASPRNNEKKPSVDGKQTAKKKKPKHTEDLPAQKATTPAALFDFGDDDLDFLALGAADRAEPETDTNRPGISPSLIKYSALSLLLFVILAVQYMVFNFQSLSHNSTLRPIYSQACTLIGCTLPSNSDVSKLQATNLLIRSLRNEPGTLLVDLIIYNEADHTQTMPTLQLVFTNLDDKVMAAGTFSPAQYLQNNLNGMTTLRPHSEVHLSFRINDPGKQAKNYTLQLLPPDHA